MKAREIHVTTRYGHYHRFKDCEVDGDSIMISITEGRVENIFPMDAVELMSILKEGEENEKDNDRAT